MSSSSMLAGRSTSLDTTSTAREAREVALGRHAAFRTRGDRYGLVGQTDAGRYLTVIVAPRGVAVYALITARDSDAAERRLYRRRGG